MIEGGRKMKILLIRAGYRKRKGELLTIAPSTFPPLGLLYLAAVLEQDGHNVDILDYYMEDIPREKLQNALMSSDAVGMTIYSDDFKSSMDISRMIKDLNPDIPLIIGGPHCTFFQERSLRENPLADICVIGEGEHVILDLVKFLQGKKNLADIPGVYYRDNGAIISGKKLQVIKNLDVLPFPARHLVEKYDYGEFTFGFQLKKKVTASITSRGCPFSCRFCARYSNVINEWGFRQRTAQNILREFSEINEKYSTINIVDDNFLADKKRAHKILNGLIEMDKKIDLLISGVRVDTADKDLYKKMKQAGVKYLAYGVESGNQDVLDFYNKKITLQQIKKAVKLAREMNFFIIATFILGAPIETKEHIKNTIRFACSLPIDVAGFGPLIYQKGSQLWNEAVSNNKISEEDGFQVFADSGKGLGNFTEDELSDYVKLAHKKFYNRSAYLFKQLYRIILHKNYRLLFNGLVYLFRLKKMGELVR